VPAPPAAARPQFGMSVRNAQLALKRLGYDPGPLDNVYGRLTRNAVIQLQRAQHLPATGVLDRETWSAIVAQLIP
jgi:g-D-glutamyl-meso-diaminopimelate peptidase